MSKSRDHTYVDTSKKSGQPEDSRVAVLICSYNGAQFISEQMRTIAEQTVPLVDIYVSDDGSSDETRVILKAIGKTWPKGRFEIFDGPKRGFAENFRSLITNRAIEADFFAFSDQDDHWYPDHLANAVAWLRQCEGTPALHCGRTQIIDVEGNPIGFSPLFARLPTFRNALVQSIAGGNTMTMNRAARDVVADATDRTSFVTHDWWCYQVITGTGGSVKYAANATVGYRQHSANLVGQNASIAARVGRFRRLLSGQFSDWNARNIAGLRLNAHLLSAQSLETIALFEKARHGPVVNRLRNLRRSKVFRQTKLGEAGLYLACLLGKL